jgi:hypothetical protein
MSAGERWRSISRSRTHILNIRLSDAHLRGAFLNVSTFLHVQPLVAHDSRVASLITAINVLVAVGFSVAGLVNPKWILPASYVPTEASFIFALYAAARTIPLAVIALVAIYQRSESAILLLGTLAGFIQLLDAGVGLLQHDLGKSIGPLVIAAFQLLAVLCVPKT